MAKKLLIRCFFIIFSLCNLRCHSDANTERLPPVPLACDTNLTKALNPGFEAPGINSNSDLVSNNSFILINQTEITGWKTTASDQLFEYWGDGFSGVTAPEGSNFVEFNANEPSTLWQSLDTSPGSWVRYGFAHGQRDAVTEQLKLFVGVNEPSVKNPATENSGNVNYVNDLSAIGLNNILTTTSAKVKDFTYYEGFFRVPAGQTKTTFALQSTASNASAGNFLDVLSIETVCIIYNSQAGSLNLNEYVTDLGNEALSFTGHVVDLNGQKVGELDSLGLSLSSGGLMTGTVNSSYAGWQRIQIISSNGLVSSELPHVFIDINGTTSN